MRCGVMGRYVEEGANVIGLESVEHQKILMLQFWEMAKEKTWVTYFT